MTESELLANGDSNRNIVWVVPPTLEYTTVWHCICGLFGTEEGRIIDPTTGQLTNRYHNGHGGPGYEFVYDRERNLFGHPGYSDQMDIMFETVGMHPPDEFAEKVSDSWLLRASEGLIAVENVDSSLREYSDHSPNTWWLTNEALSGQFAVMYNRRLVTDFIFNDCARFNFRNFSFIAMRLESEWGLIDRNGDTALPFIFSRLLIIDDNTAFARYNGRYGILDIRLSMQN